MSSASQEREEAAGLLSRGSGLEDLWETVRSPALGVAFIHGASGLAFVAANLLFARALDPEAYGRLALVIALVNFAMPLAPAGADGVVNRRPLEPDFSLLARVLATSSVAAVVCGSVAAVFYDLGIEYVAVISLAVLGGGATYLSAAQFQSRQKFGISLAISQGVNVILALAGGALLIGLLPHAESVAASMAAGLSAAAIIGWALIFRDPEITGEEDEAFDWREALSYAGVSAAILLLLQLERLVIPKLLTLEALATFGVLASVVGAPFRMMQQALGFTLFPRLRAAEGLAERRIMLLKEGLTAAAVLTTGGIAIWFAAPLVVELALDTKYRLSDPLILAAMISGALKVLDAFAKSSVSALGTVRELSLFNFLGWGAVAMGIGGAIVGARWGLEGVIYGVGAGWAGRSIAGVVLAAPHLRHGHDAGEDSGA